MSSLALIDYERFSLPDRVWSRIVKTEVDSGCWLFQGSTGDDGYARIRIEGTSLLLHRLVYFNLVDRIALHLSLDHLCRVRHCVNPAHLEPVPHAENVRRGEAGSHNRIKTKCRNGHPYDETNTYRAADGSRNCRICNSEAAARYKARRQERSAA